MTRKRRGLVAIILAFAIMVSNISITFATSFQTIEAATYVVISQIYGGGGNSGARYKNDFIELYNPTNQDIDLNGWQIQYASKTGSFGSNNTNLEGRIKAHSYYLIQQAAGNGGIILGWGVG